MGALQEVQEAAARVAGEAGPAVVGIGQGWGLGSGVVIGEGLVLTSAHNIRGEEVAVTFVDGRTVGGHLAGADVDGDLAVIRVDTACATPLAWAEAEGGEGSEGAAGMGAAGQGAAGIGAAGVGSQGAAGMGAAGHGAAGVAAAGMGVGTVVFGLANPGGRGLRVTLGLVSALGRSFEGPRGRRVTGALEHTAPLVRGSSGGAVVDVAGRFVGLNTNRLGEGFYAAIPADAELRRRVDALSRGETPARRYLGIALAPARAARQLRRSVGLPERDGLLVRAVEPDSPAGRAGLRQGDLIVEAAGRAVVRVDDLYQALDGMGDGESLPVGVVRGAADLSVSVTFGTTREEGSA